MLNIKYRMAARQSLGCSLLDRSGVGVDLLRTNAHLTLELRARRRAIRVLSLQVGAAGVNHSSSSLLTAHRHSS